MMQWSIHGGAILCFWSGIYLSVCYHNFLWVLTTSMTAFLLGWLVFQGYDFGNGV